MSQTTPIQEFKQESLKSIFEQINSFLIKDAPHVISIRGKWGTGKTYAWKQIIREVKHHDGLIKPKYSYVSLFGLKSSDDLAYAIFENSVGVESLDKEPSPTSFMKNIKTLTGGLSKWHFLLTRFTGVSSLGEIFKETARLSLRDTIICIDDLERKSDSLPLKDVFGLISQLKEQRKCKIAIIFNSDELDGEGKNEYEKFAEKVIDVEFKFDPKPSECSAIAFGGNYHHGKYAYDFANNLNVKNIRLLKKIKDFFEEIEQYLHGYNQQVKHQAFLSVFVFVWCYYGKADQVPNVDFVKQYNRFSFDMRSVVEEDQAVNNDEKNKMEEKWSELLTSVEYSSTDAFDLVILDYIETGLCDKNKLIAYADELQKLSNIGEARNNYKNIWEVYWDTFEDNSIKVKNLFVQHFDQYARYHTLPDLDAVVRLFRELGFEEDADALIHNFFAVHSDEFDIFNIEKISSIDNVQDEELIKIAKQKFLENKPSLKLEQVLENLAEKNGWGHEEMDFLAGISVEEFYDLFKQSSGKRLTLYINTCLDFNRISNPDDQVKKVVKNASLALQKIGKESKINKLRVSPSFRRYGIDLRLD